MTGNGVETTRVRNSFWRSATLTLMGLAITSGCGGCGGSGDSDPGPCCDVPDSSVVVDVDGNLPQASKNVCVYVAGESIEQRNRYVAPPFLSSGLLNDRGGGSARNDDDEYGWMMPLADRFRLRDSTMQLQFVGAGRWVDADDQPYSGTYPSDGPYKTSAISGTDIESWVTQRGGELTAKTHCYDIAFVARGGNDFGNDNDDDYKTRLKDLIRRVDGGSKCQTHPIIYVTCHLPDDQRESGQSVSAFQTIQEQRFVTRTKAAVNELTTSDPAIKVRVVDQWTPFKSNTATTAFPNETWSSGGVIDYAKIARTTDKMHPRRLASIYAGEIAADAINLTELQGMTTGACVAP